MQPFTSWFSLGDDPNEFTKSLLEFADALVAEFKGDEAAGAAVMSLEDARLEWIWEQGGFSGWEDADRRYDAPHATRASAHSNRSVFDGLV